MTNKLLLIFLTSLLIVYQCYSELDLNYLIDKQENTLQNDFKSNTDLNRKIQEINNDISIMMSKKDFNSAFANMLKLSEIYLGKDDIQNSKLFLHRANTILKQKDTYQDCKFRHQLSIIKFSFGDYKDALREILMCESKINDINDNFLKTRIYSTLARVYIKFQDYHLALEHELKAIETAKLTNNLQLLLETQIKLAGIYNYLNESMLSNDILTNCKRAANENNLVIHEIMSLIGLGSLMINMEKDIEAFNYLTQAENILKVNPDGKLRIFCLYNLSIANMNLDKYIESTQNIDDCIGILNEFRTLHLFDLVYDQYATLEINKGNLSNAESLVKTGIRFSDEYGTLREKQALLGLLLKIKMKKGNLKDVITIQNEIIKLKDFSNNKTLLNVSTLIKTKQEIESQISNILKENEKIILEKKYLTKIIISGFIIGTLLIIGIFVWLTYKKKLDVKTNALEFSTNINEKIHAIIHKDIIKTMLPITVHIYNTTKTKNQFIRDDYQYLTDKLNEILYEVNKY